MTVPASITKNERQQSAVNIEMRISRRLLMSGVRYSLGIEASARSSALETKSGKNTVGMMANATHIPAVSTKLSASHERFFTSRHTSRCEAGPTSSGVVPLRKFSVSSTFFRASIASSGMVNSAMTSIDATVRNFAYIGT